MLRYGSQGEDQNAKVSLVCLNNCLWDQNVIIPVIQFRFVLESHVVECSMTNFIHSVINTPVINSDEWRPILMKHYCKSVQLSEDSKFTFYDLCPMWNNVCVVGGAVYTDGVPATDGILLYWDLKGDTAHVKCSVLLLTYNGKDV